VTSLEDRPGSGAAIRAAGEQIQDPESRVLARIAEMRKRRPALRETKITMSHGAGGKASHALVTALFAEVLSNPTLEEMGDCAAVAVDGLTGARIAVSTDSFVVSPLVFPGGDIGELAVNGTVNDLAMGGAEPVCLSAAFILEEGLSVDTLRSIVESMKRAADRAGVQIVTGDTKVVPRGKADQLFITTTGVGLIRNPGRISSGRVIPGDVVLVSGAIGDHGCTVMLARGDVDLEAPLLRSDTPGSTSTSCVTPPAVASPPCSTRWPCRRAWVSPSTRTHSPSTTRCAGSRRSSASTRSTSPTRASWSRWWRATTPSGRLR